MAAAGRPGLPRRPPPLPALIPWIKGTRLSAPAAPSPEQPPTGLRAMAGGAGSGESKHRGEEGEARWPVPGARWKSRRGKDCAWRRDGEGPLSAPQHPPSPLSSPFYFCPQPPCASPSQALCPQALLPPRPHRYFSLFSASFQPQQVPVSKGCWLR